MTFREGISCQEATKYLRRKDLRLIDRTWRRNMDTGGFAVDIMVPDGQEMTYLHTMINDDVIECIRAPRRK